MSTGKDPAEMMEDDLILCSRTVPGFSFRNKLWGEQSFSRCLPARTKALKLCVAEFAVADINDINWNPLSSTQLAIPSKQKELIQALTEAHTGQRSDHLSDNFGKTARPDNTFALWPPIVQLRHANGLCQWAPRPR
jgi:hypothetical protein